MRIEARAAACAAALGSLVLLGACGGGGSGGGAGGAGHAVTGTVVGAPGATVLLTGPRTASATIGGSGEFRFTGLPDGEYALAPSLDGYAFTPAQQSVAVRGADVAAAAVFSGVSGPLIWGESNWNQVIWQ